MSRYETIYNKLDGQYKSQFKTAVNDVVKFIDAYTHAFLESKNDEDDFLDGKKTLNEVRLANAARWNDMKVKYDNAYHSALFANDVCEEFDCEPIFPVDLDEESFTEFTNNTGKFVFRFIASQSIGINQEDISFSNLMDMALDMGTKDFGKLLEESTKDKDLLNTYGTQVNDENTSSSMDLSADGPESL